MLSLISPKAKETAFALVLNSLLHKYDFYLYSIFLNAIIVIKYQVNNIFECQHHPIAYTSQIHLIWRFIEMDYTNTMNQMLEQSQTADIPVYNAVKYLEITISKIRISSDNNRLNALLHTIKSSFYQLIKLAFEYYKLRKAIIYHNIPYYSNPTRCDIIDNNYKFRNLYSQIQNDIYELEIIKAFMS